jgi:cyanophycin synthetase
MAAPDRSKRESFTPVAEMTTGEIWREVRGRLRLARSAGPFAAWRSLRAELAVARIRRTRRLETARRIWTDAAAQVGAELESLGSDVFEIRRGTKSTRVIRERVMLNDAVSIEIAETKPLARRLLTAAGLPVPEWCEFEVGRPEPAHRLLDEHKPPFVVKPTAASGGRGVTTNICSREDLHHAASLAARFGSRLVLERQATGDVYRLLVLDDRVIDVVRRLRPRLAGDGRSTIAQLIAAENRRRVGDASSFVGLPIDFDCLFTLKAQDLRLSSVPAAGVAFTPRTVTNYNAEFENETVDQPIATALREEAVRARQCLNLRLAALDIVTTRLDRGLGESGGILLEVNPVPGLHHHYRVADPSQSPNVAVEILQRLLA